MVSNISYKERRMFPWVNGEAECKGVRKEAVRKGLLPSLHTPDLTDNTDLSSSEP